MSFSFKTIHKEPLIDIDQNDDVWIEDTLVYNTKEKRFYK